MNKIFLPGLLFLSACQDLGCEETKNRDRPLSSLYSTPATEVWEDMTYAFSNSETSLDEGIFRYREGNDILIAAPHHPIDRNTKYIVEKLCKLYPKVSCLIAEDFRKTGRDTIRHNVNRGTVFQGDFTCRNRNPFSQKIYKAYQSIVDRSNPSLYVEIHGNARPKSKNAAEIALVGVASKLVEDSFAGLKYKIEGIDSSIFFRASEAKFCGVLRDISNALHIELPAKYREPVEDLEDSTIKYLGEGISKVSKALNLEINQY